MYKYKSVILEKRPVQHTVNVWKKTNCVLRLPRAGNCKACQEFSWNK